MIIGIDGGGTKTALVLAREDGRVLKQVRGQGTNPADLGVEECAKRLNVQLDELLRDFGGRETEIVSAYAGIAGSGAREMREGVGKALRGILPGARHLDNDTDGFNALFGESETGEGISLIAGTGSSCFALAGGEVHQVGGWGYLIDDAGSGYRMGADALRAAYRAMDGRGPATRLLAACEEKLGVPLKAAIPQIYAGGKHYIASFSRLLLNAGMEEDAEAQAIVDEASSALAGHLLAAVRFMRKLPAVTVVSGGVIESDEMLKRVGKALGAEAEKFQIVRPQVPQVYGALARAAMNAGLPVGADFRGNFKETYRQE